VLHLVWLSGRRWSVWAIVCHEIFVQCEMTFCAFEEVDFFTEARSEGAVVHHSGAVPAADALRDINFFDHIENPFLTCGEVCDIFVISHPPSQCVDVIYPCEVFETPQGVFCCQAAFCKAHGSSPLRYSVISFQIASDVEIARDACSTLISSFLSDFFELKVLL